MYYRVTLCSYITHKLDNLDILMCFKMQIDSEAEMQWMETYTSYKLCFGFVISPAKSVLKNSYRPNFNCAMF